MARLRGTAGKSSRRSEAGAVAAGARWRVEALEPRILMAAAPPNVLRGSFDYGLLAQASGNRAFLTESQSRLSVTNGTVGGILPLKTFGQIGGLEVVGDIAYLTTDNGVWQSDGTTAGTIQLLPMYNNLNGMAVAHTFMRAGASVYFYAELRATGQLGLWKTDGTASGTNFLLSGSAKPFAAVGDTLYFVGPDGEPWKTDGTVGGTTLIKDINPGIKGSVATLAGVVGNRVIFSALDHAPPGSYTDVENSLWSTDGTEAGTTRIGNAGPYLGFGTQDGFSYFVAHNVDGTSTMWKTDGTAAGTAVVKSLGAFGANRVVNLGGTFVFGGNDAANHAQIWSSDGTAAGTVPIAGQASGQMFTRVYDMVNAGGTAAFTVADSSGYSLWTTDGTAGGTSKVQTTFVPGAYGEPGQLSAAGTFALFTANPTSTSTSKLSSVQTANPLPLPKALAIGPTPYAANESGGTVKLHGYASAGSLSNNPLSYAWDLDGDGVFGESDPAEALRGDETGADPIFQAAGLDGPSTYVVQLRISDDDGYSDTTSVPITINNVAPTLSATGSASVLAEGNSFTLNLGSSDPGSDTINQWVIDWGDGVQTVPGATSQVSHNFPAGPGTYGITVKASDEDGEYRVDRAAALDASFGAGGKVTWNFSTGADGGRAVAVQPDGKIVTASTVQFSSSGMIAVSRYNPDGSPDPTFGTGGHFQFRDVSGTNASSVALQPDGRIIVAGTVLLRLLPDGSLDPSFGSNHKGWTQDFSPFIGKVRLAADGGIVVAGGATNLILGRFDPNGILDAGFGAGGKLDTGVTVNGDGVHDMTIQPDGKILVLPDGFGSTPSFLVMRLNPNGSPDPTFDGDGRATLDFGYGTAVSNSFSLAPDGAIFVAGRSPSLPTSPAPGGDDAVVVKLTSTGQLDTTFADAGRLRTAPVGQAPNSSSLVGMTLPFVRALPDGRILLAGSYYLDHLYFIADRYLASGAVDTTFAPNGRLTTDLGAGFVNYVQDVAVQRDGAPLLYGSMGSFDASEVLLRLNPPGPSVRVVDSDTPRITVSGPPTVNEGSIYTLGLAATDADGISQWIINWGDGNAQALPGDATSVAHVFPDGPKSLAVKASAIDGDGTIASVFSNLTVNNVPPSITVTGGPSVAEGSNYTVQFTATDPGTDTRTSWTVDWGDGKTNAYSASATSAQHAYADDGTYAVTVKATDEDGTFAAAPVNAVITNVAPTMDPILARVAAAGSTLQFTFTARDAVAELFSGAVDWGDGSAPSSFSLTTAAAVNAFVVNHTYASRGKFNVTVDLSDGDGGTTRGTATVHVGAVVVNVFNDADGSGTRATTELARAGATAFLDLDRDGSQGAGEPSGTTDAFGDVLFDGLSPGTAYAARVLVPDGSHVSTPAAGFADVTPGTTSASATFGLTQVAAVTGTLFNDAEGNGVRDSGDAPVALTVRARRLDTGATTTVASNSSGVYRFNALQPGPYIIELTTTTRTITAPPARRGYLVTVTGAEAEFGGLDIGSRTGTGASIGGTLFRDLNGNGVRDNGEPASANQTLYVDANDNGRRDADEWNATSDANGAYVIGRLPGGTFRVRQDLPPNAAAANDPSVSRQVTTTFGLKTAGVDLARPYERTYYVQLSSTGFITVYNGSQAGGSVFAQIAPSTSTLSTLSTSTADDWVIFDWTFGNPIPAGGFKVDGLAGNDTLSVIGTFGADAMSWSPDSVTRTGSAALSDVGVERVTFDGQGGWDDLSLTSGSAVMLDGMQYLQSLNVAAGASVVVSPRGSNTLVTRGLTLDGILDLANNSMVVKGGSFSAIEASIAAAFNHGAWTGVAGITSSAAAADPEGLTALGYASNADLRRSTFGGISGLSANDILVKYTYYGDADLSGITTLDDFTQFLHGYQTHSIATNNWLNGDFDYNDQVNLDDFTQFLYSYQRQGAKL